MEAALVLMLALALDLVWGEPPRRLHPVVGMGRVISALEGLAPRNGRGGQFIYGALATLFLLGLFSLPAYWLLGFLRAWSTAAYVTGAALLLWACFSLNMLTAECLKIKALLGRGETGPARHQLRSLVSRDTGEFSPPLMASAAVESAAENSADSFISPLFFFLLLGVPGAVAYRVVNTLDAMWGYHGRYEYLGKFAARLDDALNFIPSRLSGLLMVLAAFLGGGQGGNALRVMWRDHSRTLSPNAGWPMAAAAGALGVRLEKPGHYRLGDNHRPLSPGVIEEAVRLVRRAALLWLGLALTVEVIGFALNA